MCQMHIALGMISVNDACASPEFLTIDYLHNRVDLVTTNTVIPYALGFSAVEGVNEETYRVYHG